MTGVTAFAGFVLGSQGKINGSLLFHTCLGTLLVAGGACALNMVQEIDVDARMHRTAKRPLPAGRLHSGEGLLVGMLLSVVGLLYLSSTVNGLTAFLAGLTLSIYIYIYTPLKKMTALCTIAGAVSGALPPVIGWAAARGSLGMGALILFSILFFWQFPHFLALAWMYREDYARAGLRMLPAGETDGKKTARRIFLNSLVLLTVSLLPTLWGMTGTFYLVTALITGTCFVIFSGLFLVHRSMADARRVFLVSVIYLPILVMVMLLDRVIPGLFS